MNYLSHARSVIDVEIAGLRSVRSHLDDQFNRAVELIVGALRTRGKVVVVGVGKSGNIGRKVAATLTSTGTSSVVLDSVDALHGDLGMVNDGDVVLILSYSGESDEVVNLLPALRRFRVQILSLVGNPSSTLARHSDVVLNVGVPKEACPFNLAPTASTTATLAVGDAIAMSVLKARGFRKEDFARFHPSGAIGRSLLLGVSDIMRKGERNPVVAGDCAVKEALIEMGRARSGSVSVIDEGGKLIGVFTDGDLRRHLAAGDCSLEVKIQHVMTQGPVVIGEKALAVEALALFDKQHIDDLIVVNGRHQPVGIIDSQDLPKMKLM